MNLEPFYFILQQCTGRNPVTKEAGEMKVAFQIKGKTLMIVGIWTLC